MKALILAAGYGTRFLPITKTIPKEMLPLVNKPILSFIIEEILSSGIQDIIIVTSGRKKVLEDYLDKDIYLESFIKEPQRPLIAPFNANIVFLRQKRALGTGHAILEAKAWLKDEPFLVAYPDDVFFGHTMLSAQLKEKFEAEGEEKVILAAQWINSQFERYGILELFSDKKHVINLLEKPQHSYDSPQLVSVGRYIYTEQFLYHLNKNFTHHKTGEYYHINGLSPLFLNKKVVAHVVDGKIFDTGNLQGYKECFLHYAQQIGLHDI